MRAAEIIQRLGMQPHPEGGWYRETHRAAAADGGRGTVTAIYFLLERGQRSHWHKVDATEIWLWHAGAPVRLGLQVEGEAPEEVELGPDLAQGQRPQQVVPPDAWQAAEALAGPGLPDFALVSCVVAPAFEFAGFTLAPPGWSPAPSADP